MTALQTPVGQICDIFVWTLSLMVSALSWTGVTIDCSQEYVAVAIAERLMKKKQVLPR